MIRGTSDKVKIGRRRRARFSASGAAESNANSGGNQRESVTPKFSPFHRAELTLSATILNVRFLPKAGVTTAELAIKADGRLALH